MNREDIIDLWSRANGWSIKEFNVTVTELERFAALVAAAEREACAKVCDELHPGLSTKRAAEYIRARGQA